MSSFSIRKHIEAPIEQVFARASDFAALAETIAGIERVEMLTDGPVGKGTRFRETRIMFGREATEEMEVVEFEPPRRYALGCENHGCRYHSEMRFEAQGDGTDVEMTFEATPLSAMAKIMSSMMKPMIDKAAEICGKDLDDLKSSIEGGS